MKHQPDSFISFAIANFFDTFLVFWLSFLTVGLFNFVDQLPTSQDIPLPDVWMFVYEHIFLFSQWFVPVLLGIFIINAFLQRYLMARVVQKVIHAWIIDSVAILSGALLGSVYLGKGEIFFLDFTISGGIISIALFSFALYALSILTVSLITYLVTRYTRPKSEPLAVLSEAPSTADTNNLVNNQHAA
ncbi:MAG: hypothetical protein JHC38_10125 [Thiotrichales bacterium]|jgi:hypothetical protein|nr:hypothetical protein [Thiotrichales bacterium]